MKYYLAADGGGTKTLAVVFNDEGKILGKGLAGGGNAGLSSYHIAITNVLTACKTAISAAGLQSSDIAFANLFIPGFTKCLEEFENTIKIKSAIVSEKEELKYFALPNRDGVVVLAGTGSFASAYIGAKAFTVGAWGNILGDEGSGYDIGLMALKKCVRFYDDNRKSRLLDEVCNFFKIDDFNIFKSAFYYEENKREKVASLCPLVCRLASEGEETAARIIEKATDELADLADRAYLKSGTNRHLPVVLAGGVKNAGKVIVDPFKEKVQIVSKGQLFYIESKLEIIHGAILKTLADDGISIDKIDFEV